MDGHVFILDLKVWVGTHSVPAKRLESQKEMEDMPSEANEDQLPSQRLECTQETTSPPESWFIK